MYIYKYIQGGHKQTLPIYESYPSLCSTDRNEMYRYSYLKICARDCGEQEQWRLRGYSDSEIFFSNFPNGTPVFSHPKMIIALKKRKWRCNGTCSTKKGNVRLRTAL